jgi:hypothetical protein
MNHRAVIEGFWAMRASIVVVPHTLATASDPSEIAALAS